MPRWLAKVVSRIHELAATGAVRFTLKAQSEAVLLGLSPEDARDAIVSLRQVDSAGRVASEATGEWLYAFKPRIVGPIVYVKLALRDVCVVVSFHEDEGGKQDD